MQQIYNHLLLKYYLLFSDVKPSSLVQGGAISTGCLFNRYALSVIISFTVPVSASACFCLVDADDNFRHGCEKQLQGTDTIYLCRASDNSPIKMTDLDGWRILQSGEGRCLPCQNFQRKTDGSIRGRISPQNTDE